MYKWQYLPFSFLLYISLRALISGSAFTHLVDRRISGKAVYVFLAFWIIDMCAFGSTEDYRHGMVIMSRVLFLELYAALRCSVCSSICPVRAGMFAVAIGTVTIGCRSSSATFLISVSELALLACGNSDILVHIEV